MSRALDKQEGGDHYCSFVIQPVEYIHKNRIPFIEGCIIKYATRWRDKGGIQDLRKIIHFAELLIELEEEEWTATQSISINHVTQDTSQKHPDERAGQKQSSDTSSSSSAEERLQKRKDENW